MINFPLLRTKRLTIQLRELTIGEAITIAAMPVSHEQAECTAFLRSAVQSVDGVADPADWTVQERALAVCHYLACTSDDGPDFSVGKGAYSDYLDAARDYPLESVELGEAAGDQWSIRHLTGRMAESVERLQGELKNAAGNPVPNRLHWLLGGMACQLTRRDETIPAESQEGAFDEWLLHRMQVFAAFPESDFARLMLMFADGREQLAHLFRLEFSETGLVAMPVRAEKEGAEGEKITLPPARFPCRACLSEVAKSMV